MIEAVIEGFSTGSKMTGIEGGILICALRSYDAAHSMSMAKLVKEYTGKGVLGFDIAGDERYPLNLHREALEFCMSEGIKVTVHAGERLKGVDGTLNSIITNLQEASELGVHRIGHGYAISLDDAIFEEYKNKNGRTTIEICLSAVTPWLVPSGQYKDHPIKRYYMNNIPVALSCDNLNLAGAGPNLGTTPTKELFHLKTDCDFDWEEVKNVLLQGIKAAFVDEKRKVELIQKFTRDLDSALARITDT